MIYEHQKKECLTRGITLKGNILMSSDWKAILKEGLIGEEIRKSIIADVMNLDYEEVLVHEN